MTAPVEQKAVAFAALRILVVEDEMMLMLMIEDALADAGCTPLKTANVAKAATLAETSTIDCAILDVNVGGESVFSIAKILEQRNVPFILSTGYGRESLPAEFRDRPMLHKPYLPEQIKPAIEAALATRIGLDGLCALGKS